MGTAADLQSEWARLVVDSLVQAGVRDAVVSPGSRSAPFVIAALEHGGIRCVSALDERSGAHYALGQARATGRPSLIVCTSGSAPANYFPAVIEASEAGVPLVVLSADRPPELHGCGANQTTDQVGLYGVHVRLFANLGEPRGDELSLRATRRLATQAVLDAIGPKPGPVHINAQARKPLEPTYSKGAEAMEIHARVDAVLAEPVVQLHRAHSLDADAVERVARALDAATLPLVLCGPAPARQTGAFRDLCALAERAGVIVAAEASSQFRFGEGARELVTGAFDVIWGTEVGRSRFVPDFVLQLGANPVSKGWEQLCAAHRIPRTVVHPWEWADPTSSAEAIIRADVGSFVRALAQAPYAGAARDVELARRFRRAEELVWEASVAILEEAGDPLTEGRVAQVAIDCAPSNSAIVLGNSLPIRDVDAWAPPSDKPLEVFSQRGVSGIDGVVSGAAGVASYASGATTLLVGDVSFLHDINGLQLASKVTKPLVVVVVNNGGGRIFEQLPIARDGNEEWLHYFTTPHDADLGGAASTYGCGFQTVRTLTNLRRGLEGAYQHDGCTVIEAIVPPRSADEQSRELRSRIEEALEREAP